MATSTTPPASTASEESGDYTHAQILTILSGLMLGMFLAALDQTIVSTAIRTIADDLNGLSIQAWATTAYLITSTLTTPIYGTLGDVYGKMRAGTLSARTPEGQWAFGQALLEASAQQEENEREHQERQTDREREQQTPDHFRPSAIHTRRLTSPPPRKNAAGAGGACRFARRPRHGICGGLAHDGKWGLGLLRH